MFRLRTLGILVGMTAALAVSAVPASAWWEATGKQWKGPVNVKEAGAFVDGEGAGAARVECPAPGVEATWSDQTKGQIKLHEVEGKQVQTKFGPHLHIKVSNWGSECKAKVGSTEFPKQVVVKPCELQLVQELGSFTATGGVVTECVVKVNEPNGETFCEIKVTAGEETQAGSNTGHNVGLGTTTLTNVGSNQLDKSTTTGVKANRGSGSKTLCPIASNEKSKLEGLVFEAEGVKAV